MQTNRPEIGFDVPDDNALLDKMMADMGEAPPEYRPTNYWKFYETKFLPELRRHGLKDFRRRRYSVLNSFGATDDSLKGRLDFKIPFRGHQRLASLLNLTIEKIPFLEVGLTDSKGPWVTEFFYWYVKNKFQNAGLHLSKCPTSRFGNPEDLVEVEGQLWSRKHLNFCSILADVARRVPISNETVICELGSGLGRNAELVAKLWEGATILLFDIPPQLYTANQYLTAIFGSRVIPYAEAVALQPTGAAFAVEKIKGRICILPAWKMPDWSKCKIDLFFNSESFQEMEDAVVRNYLEHVRSMNPEHIYINALPDGVGWNKSKGFISGGGQDAPVKEGIYVEMLKGAYDLLEKYPTDNLLRRRDYHSYVFKKRPLV